MLTTYADIARQFREYILPEVTQRYGSDDEIAINEAWNNFIDGEELTDLERHCCPPFEAVDSNCDDDQAMAEYLLDELGVTARTTPVDERPDGLMRDTPRHFHVAVARENTELETYFSQGSAWTRKPTREEVLGSLFMDAESAEPDFEEFCDELGFDTDSRQAERIHKACLNMAARLRQMFPGSEYEDLAERLREL